MQPDHAAALCRCPLRRRCPPRRAPLLPLSLYPSLAALNLDLRVHVAIYFSSSDEVAAKLASVPVSLHRVLHVDAQWSPILPCQQLGRSH